MGGGKKVGDGEFYVISFRDDIQKNITCQESYNLITFSAFKNQS